MAITRDRLSTDEILRLNREHTFFSWSAQAKINPIVIDRAEGIYFWDPDGKRFIDFNSQLMSVNIGHGDRRVADAIAEQAHKLAFAAPQFATEARGRLAGSMIVRDGYEVMLISREGTIIRTAADGISRMGRSTQGVRLMNLRGDDTVSSIARVTEPTQADVVTGDVEDSATD